MDDAAWILPDQVVADLQRSGGARLRIVLQHLSPADDAGVGRDLDEDPRVGQDECLNLGDLDFVLRTDLSRVRPMGGESRIKAVQGTSAQDPANQRPAIYVHRDISFVGKRTHGCSLLQRASPGFTGAILCQWPRGFYMRFRLAMERDRGAFSAVAAKMRPE